MRFIATMFCLALMAGCTEFASHELQNAAKACGGIDKVSYLHASGPFMTARCMNGRHVSHAQIMEGVEND